MSKSYSYFDRLKGRPKRVKAPTVVSSKTGSRRYLLVVPEESIPHVDPIAAHAAVGPGPEY